MQSLTGSVSPPAAHPAWELLARAARHLRGLAMAERPPMRWAEMKPIDFEGEDTSLAQDQLHLLR